MTHPAVPRKHCESCHLTAEFERLNRQHDFDKQQIRILEEQRLELLEELDEALTGTYEPKPAYQWHCWRTPNLYMEAMARNLGVTPKTPRDDLITLLEESEHERIRVAEDRPAHYGLDERDLPGRATRPGRGAR